jgi:hypothetical protein
MTPLNWFVKIQAACTVTWMTDICGRTSIPLESGTQVVTWELRLRSSQVIAAFRLLSTLVTIMELENAGGEGDGPTRKVATIRG